MTKPFSCHDEHFRAPGTTRLPGTNASNTAARTRKFAALALALQASFLFIT